jgi:hypothetical protein
LRRCEKNRELQMLILIALLAASIQPANAPERLTVAQLEEKLNAPIESPPPHGEIPLIMLQDANLAFQIERLQLSERLTPATLETILARHSFGTQTQQSLHLLADRSAFLDPPQSEQVDRPAPNATQEQEILEATRAYVFKTLTHLPNFFATRTTSRFFGIPPELNQTGKPMNLGLHPRGTYSREITYRDGKEVLDPMKARTPLNPHADNNSGLGRWTHSGLESWGEFGPEPAVILVDSDYGTIAFHHWEQSPQGVLAVFHFSVPAADSHYEVNYSCNGSNSFHAQPAYRGSLAVDPASGAILRIVLQADSNPNDPISHVASVIEYGPVEIGGRTYICPLRSLAFSVEEPNGCSIGGHYQKQVQPMLLNRTIFADYHRLGSTARIITDAPDMPPPPQTAEPHQ